MDIIIAGAGRVGFRLAKTLCTKHNVTVIDQNEDALNRLQESIDILAIVGNIENPKTYDSLVDRESDLFIAVTDMDETNIISTLIASETINVRDKIIRLRNEFFAKSSIGEKIGITASVFPFHLSANSVKSLLDFPKANNVKTFDEFEQKLISVRAASSISLENIISDSVKVVGIERDGEFFIPSVYETTQKDDLIYLFGNVQDIKELSLRIDPQMPIDIENIVIFGADMLGIEIAKLLSNYNVNIKIIEKDIGKCQKASDVLQENVTVINSKYGEYHLFKEENLENADMLIASSKNDEENIIKCLEAKEHKIKKIVAINNDLEHYYLMHKLGIVAVRGPKTNAYYSILEKISSSSIVKQRKYCGGKGVLMSRKIYKNSPLLDTFIRPLDLQNSCSFVLRDEKIEDFDKKIEAQEGDVILAFGVDEDIDRIEKWINSL